MTSALDLASATRIGIAESSTSESGRWWTRLELWRTALGRFVAVRTTCRDGVEKRAERVFERPSAAQSWLGFGKLALELYRRCGWSI